MTFTEYIKEKLNKKSQGNKKKILFIDGTDQRSQEAATKHANDGLIEPILLFEKISEKIDGPYSTLIMEEYQDKDKLIQKYVERRKGKETEEQAKVAITKRAIFAMLMLELGEVDGVIGGLEDASAVILSAAFKVIGPKPGTKTISSVMVMAKEESWYIYSDISVNIMPNAEQLSEIAKNAVTFAGAMDLDKKVAFLSFSTLGSAVHERSTFVREAVLKYNESNPEVKAIGEIQFDAAMSEKVRQAKYKEETFEGNPNIMVFPSLEAGNIGYKIAQRLGGYGAIGPIITGINKPVNDLSRGALTDDVYNTALLTALQTFE